MNKHEPLGQHLYSSLYLDVINKFEKRFFANLEAKLESVNYEMMYRRIVAPVWVEMRNEH